MVNTWTMFSTRITNRRIYTINRGCYSSYTSTFWKGLHTTQRNGSIISYIIFLL